MCKFPSCGLASIEVTKRCLVVQRDDLSIKQDERLASAVAMWNVMDFVMVGSDLVGSKK